MRPTWISANGVMMENGIKVIRVELRDSRTSLNIADNLLQIQHNWIRGRYDKRY